MISYLHISVMPLKMHLSEGLTTLTIAEHGFALSKGEFRDALCLRFGWQPVNLPQACVCTRPF